MQSRVFLVEIGTEELPPNILRRLGCDFAYQISNALKKNNIYCIEVNWFASSRHLAVKSKIRINDINITISNNILDQCNNIQDVLYVAGVNNNHNKILNIDVQEKRKDEKNIEQNYSTHNILCEVVSVALAKLKNYKMMKWGKVKTAFIRPVHTVTILLDTCLIKGCFFGINTDRVLYGHQCMENNKIIIKHANDYPDILFEKGQVIVDYNKRKNIICLGVKEAARKIGGIVNMQDSNLLDEITSFVEWPVVLFGKFDNKFLNLPNEIIQHIMQCDQKYFSVYNVTNGALLPYFIFVVNIITNDYKKVIIGYENVIKTRLMDAEFFFRKDDQYILEDYVSKLDSVLFHRNLGTLREKSCRISILSGWIAEKVGLDVQQAKRAGYLCKCDLMSSMVFEFPWTQGIIGMFYALRDGETEEVALAQKEHYNPKFATDMLPTTFLSCAVAIADKMDTISGIFGIEALPKGNRDPFALRRFALGILRILIQKKISLNLFDLIEKSTELYELKLCNSTVMHDIHLFMYQRLCSWYYTNNFKKDIIKSVLAVDYFNVLNVDMRMHAVNSFLSLKKEDNFYKLYFIYKRISSILPDKQVFLNEHVRSELLEYPEEMYLFNQIVLVEEKFNFYLKGNDYYEALILLLVLFNPVNVFFNNIIVMDKNKKMQKNRLILLNRIRCLFLRIMDFSVLHV